METEGNMPTNCKMKTKNERKKRKIKWKMSRNPKASKQQQGENVENQFRE